MVLAMIYGMTLVLPAAILMVSSMISLRKSRFAKHIQVVLPIVFGVGLLLNTTRLSGTFLFWLVIYLHTHERRKSESSFGLFVIFVICSFTGELFLLFAPSFVIILWNLRSKLGRWRTIVPLSGVLVGTLINLWSFSQRLRGVTFGRASNEGLTLSLIAQNKTLVYTLIATFFLLVAVSSKLIWLLWMNMILALVFFLIAVQNGAPTGHMLFRERYVMGGLLAILSLMICLSSTIKVAANNSSQGKVGSNKSIQGNVSVALSSIFALILQIQIFIPYSNFVSNLSREVNSCDGVVSFGSVGFPESQKVYAWDYTIPTVSRLLWKSKDGCLVENSNPELWQPFTPGETDPFQRQLYWD